MTTFANTTSRYLTAEKLIKLPAQFGTPIWIYDSEVITQAIQQLTAFDVIRFAQKACSNIHILRLMREQGAKVDAVSLGEIERALVAGFRPGREQAEIVFTADVIVKQTIERVIELDIPVNVGSITCSFNWEKPNGIIPFGYVSIQVLAMDIAKKPTLVEKIVSTLSGLAIRL